MKFYLFWILSFVLVQAVLTLLQFIFRKHDFGKGARTAIIILKALLAVACGVIVMGGPVLFRPVQPVMVTVYAVLFMDAFADFIYSIILCIKKSERKFAVQKALSLILGILFFVYGTINMETVRPSYHTFTSSKIEKEYKLVFLADLHAGNAQPAEVYKKTIEKIKAENPDMVILGGDITDDYTTKAEMEELYGLFGNLGVPVYFVYGNHEVTSYEKYTKNDDACSVEDLERAMEKNNITILCDEYCQFSDDILLLGREDAALKEERADISKLKNPSPGSYLITIDHQPVCAEDNLKAGTDLQLSGHTHAGQLFPNGLFFSFVSYTKGEYEVGDAVMYVSPGVSGWRVPFRTESTCRYEVITLKPEK